MIRSIVLAWPGLRRRGDTLSGIAMVLAAMACFSASDVLAKQLSARLPAVEIAWFRYFGLLITLAPLWLRERGRLRSARRGVQATRAVALVASAVFFILALQALPVAEATAMVFASPLFVTLLSALALRERVEPLRWAIVATGFVGVLIVMRPGSDAFRAAALLPIASSIAWAIAVVCTRKASGSDGVSITMLHSAVIGFAILAYIALPVALLPTRGEALLLGAMATAWSAAQWLTVAAYHRSDASTLAPFAYSQLLWSSMLGYLVFSQMPDPTSLAGIAVIAGCGLGAAYLAARGPLAKVAAATPLTPAP